MVAFAPPHTPAAPTSIRSSPCAVLPTPSPAGTAASRWSSRSMSAGSTSRPRYGSRCAARGSNGSQAQPGNGAASNGNGTQEQPPEPADILELDAAALCEGEECLFPDHDAFSPERKKRRLRNQVQLSCYADAIGSGLPDLRRFIDDHLDGVVSGLHLLPIYPSSGDGGFAPLTYKEVNPELGTWEDVRALADKLDLELELMVNHISPASAEFQDFLQRGDASDSADMFIDWDRFWPEGDPSEAELAAIRTRKAEAPVLSVTMADGSTRRVWCTFGPQQIDIDPFSEPGRKFVEDSLESLCERGAKIVRLDAFGYATKKLGTRCFFEEPEVWEMLERLNVIAKKHDTRLLCEVHEDFQLNLRLAARGYWVYDFALPLLVLHAFHFQSGSTLRHWLRICPRRQFTVLDTHDGMGIDDIATLVSVCDVEEVQEMVETKLNALPNFKYKREDGGYRSYPHQLNATYFSACRETPRAYLLARAIQFWTPGVPMVYYVGLLAGVNDPDGVAREGPRGINRHRYTPEEAAAELERPVVKALFAMCKFRNHHPAFNGQIGIRDEAPEEDHLLRVTWRNGPHHATLHADLRTFAFDVVASAITDAGQEHTMRYELEDDTSWCRERFDDANVIPTDQLQGLRTDELANVVDEFAEPARASRARDKAAV